MTYYTFWAIQGLQALHDEGIAIQNITPATLGITREQQVKFTDFSNAVSFESDDSEGNASIYETHSYNKGYTTAEVEAGATSGSKVTKRQLIENDKYALAQTLQQIADQVSDLYTSYSSSNSSAKSYYVDIIADLKTHSLTDVISKWSTSLSASADFSSSLSQ